MENEIDQQQEVKDTAPLPSTNFFDKFSKKQRLVALGIAIFIIVVVTLLGFLLQNKSKPLQTPNTAGSSSVQHTQAFPTVVPTPVLVAPTSWYTIKTQYYSVNVPKGWLPDVQTMQGGVSVIISPKNAAEDPLLVVESFDGPVSIASKVALFEAEGLKAPKNISNTQAVMLTGTWGTRTINGKTIKIPTQERLVFIPHGNSEFTIRFYYSSPHPEAVYDTILEKVIASFTPTQ